MTAGPADPMAWADGPNDSPNLSPANRVAYPATASSSAPIACPGLCAPVCPDPCADPCFAGRRGPIEVRDQFLLAQPFLTLPATSPDTLGRGRSSIRVQGVWSSSFGWRQLTTGENPPIRYFLVDGEARTVEAVVTHGFTNNLDVGVRVPFHWRGGGHGDDWIDSFHGLFAPIGVSDNKRDDFKQDAFRINGLNDDGSSFSADQDKGSAFGNLEAFAKWRFVDGGRDRWSWAAIARVTAPTGAAPFDSPGYEGAIQIVGARRLARDWDLFLGAGVIGRTETVFQGMHFSDVVGHVFVAVERRFGPRWSILLETEYATVLADGIQRYDVDRWSMDLGAKYDITPDTTLDFGFVENFISQQTTLDIGLHLGIEFRF